MPSSRVLYDANVLFPAPLRDLLMHLALLKLLRAKWTNKIHEEWIRNVLKKRPEVGDKRCDLIVTAKPIIYLPLLTVYNVLDAFNPIAMTMACVTNTSCINGSSVCGLL